jgi:hypothetical protein
LPDDEAPVLITILPLTPEAPESLVLIETAPEEVDTPTPL